MGNCPIKRSIDDNDASTRASALASVVLLPAKRASTCATSVLVISPTSNRTRAASNWRAKAALFWRRILTPSRSRRKSAYATTTSRIMFISDASSRASACAICASAWLKAASTRPANQMGWEADAPIVLGVVSLYTTSVRAPLGLRTRDQEPA